MSQEVSGSQGASEPSPAPSVSPVSASERPRVVEALPHSVADRLAVWIPPARFFLKARGLGIHGARAFSELIPDYDVSPYTGISVAVVAAILLIALEAFFARSPIRTIAGVTIGILLGLALAVVFKPLVMVMYKAVVPPGLREEKLDTMVAFLNLMTTSIFSYYGVTLVISTRDEFKFIIPYVEFRKEIKSHVPLILDTSVFIDGRLLGLLTAGVFDQRLLVPRFVLDELQRVADSADKSLRERGRRGLEMLNDVERRHSLAVVDFPLQADEEVDVGLVRMTIVHEGKLVTTDHNLSRRANVQGVSVINVNDVATAMKPAFVPGQVLRLRLQRAGDDPGQAVGFLDDGTMVVVDDARENIGQEVSVEVRSALQTNAGKMVFGKLARADRGSGKSS